METIVPEIEERRAYRALDATRIAEETLERMLAAATLAPSCANNQPWRFLAITDSAMLSQVKEHLSGGNYWAKTAPAIVLVCTNPEDDCRLSGGRDYALFDTGMATMNLMLQGVREGLHTHPIAGFDPKPIKQVVGIPEEVILVTLVIIGSPGEPSDLNEKHQQAEAGERSRKPEADVIAYDRWPKRWQLSS